MLYLELFINNKWEPLSLPEDVSISMEEKSPLWNDSTSGAFSIPFQVDMDDNLHIFGTVINGHGQSIFKFNKTKFRLFYDGIVFLTGVIKLSEEVEIEIDENTGHRTIEISIESNRKEFDDILDGVKIKDLNIEQYGIQIGYCLPKNLPFTGTYRHEVYGASPRDWLDGKYKLRETVTYTQSVALPPVMISDYHDNRHNGEFTHDFTNVQEPYNPNDPFAHPYCNVRSAYQKYVYDKEWKEERGTSVGEPNRVNTAPCFYFGFIHDIMFSQLKLAVTSNALNELLDYRRLAFWHANCEYDAIEIPNKLFSNDNPENRYTIYAEYRSGNQSGRRMASNKDAQNDWWHCYWLDRSITPEFRLCKAIANSDNLPDIGAEDLVNATKSAFGARYIYDAVTGTVKIILIRDVLGSDKTETPNDIEVVGDITRSERDTRGIVFKYSVSSEQAENSVTKEKIRTQGDDNTTYNYYDYRNVYVIGWGKATYNVDKHRLEYTTTDTNVDSFTTLVQNITDNDLTLYIDPHTSMAYYIKVDKDAKIASEWYPSLFPVATYRDVTIGDVSDDDYVETITIPFTPALPITTNFKEQYNALINSGLDDNDDGTDEKVQMPIAPKYGQLIDGEIHHKDNNEQIERLYVYNQIPVAYIFDYKAGRTAVSCHVDVNLKVFAEEDFEVSNGNDGPYQSMNPEFVLGIMRGSGANAQTILYDEDYDGEGHAYYIHNAGTDAEFTSDTMDSYGNMYDYNGSSGLVDVTREQAEMYARVNFPDSNIDIMKYYRKDMIFVKQVNGFYVLYTTLTDDNIGVTDSVWTPKYEGKTTTKAELFNLDAQNYRVIIGIYETQNEANQMKTFLWQLYIVHFEGDGQVQFPENGLGYSPRDLISLRLKSEIPINGNPALGYYPVTNPVAERRGLADKFYGTYFHWVMNSKKAIIPCLATVSRIKSLDWFTRYNIAGYIGFLNKKTYTLTHDGVKNLKLEQYYL